MSGGAGGGGNVLGGLAATWLQGGWTARRLLRGRMLWVAAFFALGPIAFTVLIVQSGHTARWEELFAPLALLCGLVPPLFTASTMAEEIEDRTYTYLWSRPLPRWTVLIGKLVATVPVAAVLLSLTALICYQLGQRGISPDHPWPSAAAGRAVGAVALAALALSMVAGGLAVMMPRHGLGVAYAYLLVLDLPLGLMPFSIANLSMSHHIQTLGGVRGTDPNASIGAAVLWLVGIGLFWLILGLWRISKSEFASGEK
ncbi:MAG TPA: ABC transporter permease subunit [Kofleriaceae bacterium]|jgi:ABC-type transport system involved in multi-copper enzyme maturation permease subunit|nr:ABC transporter permease subunit [Kofleriaceae bacterium]